MIRNSRNQCLVVLGIAAVVFVGVFLLLQTALTAQEINGESGFPLDDPWIHLQFAHNLHEYGTFSYYKDERVTAGSTSPLYTVLLAVGLACTKNEFLLSYILGGSFLVLSVVVIFLLARRMFGNRLPVALAASAFVAFEPRLIWVSLSGMETTLFIALLLAVTLCYVEERPVLLGVTAGLLLWTRPEAVLMMGSLAADAVYRWKIVRVEGDVNHPPSGSPPKWLLSSLVIASVFGAGYAIFNFVLSGTLLPNTFAAKIKYYSSGGGDFPSQVFWFLSADHMMTIAPFAVIGGLGVMLLLARRRPAPMLVPLLWTLGMICAYWWKLPYLYQNGRYLMPVLPFVFLLAISGLDVLVKMARRRVPLLKTDEVCAAIYVAVFLVMIGSTAGAAWTRRDYFVETCRYVTQRQVSTAYWVRDHLPEGAVVATHDVGALAFYSGRRIVDMVGLISPEMIDHIGDVETMVGELRLKGVTHIAVLRSWFEISNVHPQFSTNEAEPEVMEVFLFDPDRMHFTNKTASALTELARRNFVVGNVKKAIALLETALTYDAKSARIHLLLGQGQALEGRLDDADREFRVALALQENLWDARFGRADVAAKRQLPQDAIVMLEELLSDNPSYSAGYEYLAILYANTQGNAEKAAYFLRRFNELSVEADTQPTR